MAKYEYWLTNDGLTLLEGWARDGLTDEQIAKDCMDIAYSTFREWKKKYPALSAALKKNKEIVDREVENALLKRAKGYRYEEVKIEEGVDGIKRTTTIKEVPPDPTSCFFWLKNRRPNEYRDKRDVEHSGGINIEVVWGGDEN